MKFAINTKEFKQVMHLVKTVADSASNARITSHSVCLLSAFPEEKQLKLEFSLNGSFLSYTFNEVSILNEEELVEGDVFRRSVDLGSLATLKFSGTTITIGLGRNKEGNTLEFSSGKLKGKLILSHPDIEKEVEATRMSVDTVELTQQFSVSEFISLLSAHNYGMHHSTTDALKRPVRIYSKKGSEDETIPNQIFFVSKDKIAAASFTKPMTIPYKDDFNYYVLPKPFQAVMNALSQDVSPVFHFGISKDLWRISHGNINIWFPNIVPDVNFDLDELITSINTYSCFKLTTSPECLQAALSEIAPFTSSAHLFTKEDMPIVRLTVANNIGYITVNTSKAKDVVVEIENTEFETGELNYDPSDILNLNFKYLSECVAALTNIEEKGSPVVKDKEKVVKEKEKIQLIWWNYRDTNAPTKGKAFCLRRGNNYYCISRVKDQQRQI